MVEQNAPETTEAPGQDSPSMLGNAGSALAWVGRTFFWDTNDSLGSNLVKVGLTGGSILLMPFSGGGSLAARGLLTGVSLTAGRTGVAAMAGRAMAAAGSMAETVAPKLAQGASRLFTAPVTNKATGLAVSSGARTFSAKRAAATVGAATLATGNADQATLAAKSAALGVADVVAENAEGVNRVTGDPAGKVQRALEDGTAEVRKSLSETFSAENGASQGGSAQPDTQSVQRDAAEAGNPLSSIFGSAHDGLKAQARNPNTLFGQMMSHPWAARLAEFAPAIMAGIGGIMLFKGGLAGKIVGAALLMAGLFSTVGGDFFKSLTGGDNRLQGNRQVTMTMDPTADGFGVPRRFGQNGQYTIDPSSVPGGLAPAAG